MVSGLEDANEEINWHYSLIKPWIRISRKKNK